MRSTVNWLNTSLQVAEAGNVIGMAVGHDHERELLCRSPAPCVDGGAMLWRSAGMHAAVDQDVLRPALSGTVNRKKSPKPTRYMRTRSLWRCRRLPPLRGAPLPAGVCRPFRRSRSPLLPLRLSSSSLDVVVVLDFSCVVVFVLFLGHGQIPRERGRNRFACDCDLSRQHASVPGVCARGVATRAIVE